MSTKRRCWHAHRNFNPYDRDYQGAGFFIAAGEGHSRRMRRGRQRNITHIVIHITGGASMDESGAVNRFRSHTGHASIHYIVNREGAVVQMVREQHIANHLRGGFNGQKNRQSIGIEHVNPYNRNSHQSPEEVQYNASANLVAYLCNKYKVPIIHSTSFSTSGIIGHCEIDQRTTHTSCPNAVWDWPAYIEKVRSRAAQERRRDLEFDHLIDRLIQSPNSILRSGVMKF